jgi:hypothetical protein
MPFAHILVKDLTMPHMDLWHTTALLVYDLFPSMWAYRQSSHEKPENALFLSKFHHN